MWENKEHYSEMLGYIGGLQLPVSPESQEEVMDLLQEPVAKL
jgi:hypothetical protein